MLSTSHLKVSSTIGPHIIAHSTGTSSTWTSLALASTASPEKNKTDASVPLILSDPGNSGRSTKSKPLRSVIRYRRTRRRINSLRSLVAKLWESHNTSTRKSVERRSSAHHPKEREVLQAPTPISDSHISPSTQSLTHQILRLRTQPLPAHSRHG